MRRRPILILGLAWSVLMVLTVVRADEPTPDEVTLEMAAGFHHRSARHPLNVGTGQPTFAACIGVQGQKNPFKDKTMLAVNPPATLGDQGDLTTPDWVFLGEGASLLKVTEYYTVRGEITIRLYDASDTCIKTYTVAKEGLESGGPSQVQKKEILLWDVDDPLFATNRVKTIRATAATAPPQGAHNAGGYVVFTARVAVGVDLQFQNMSVTVADGMATHTMGESEEESEGAELRINANFDEGNTQNGNPLEDYLGSDHIEPDDHNLLKGDVILTGATAEDTIAFQLEKSAPQAPDALAVWIQKSNGDWKLAQWDAQYAIADYLDPNSAASKLPVRVEGIGGSHYNKDHRILVNFYPKNSAMPIKDTAAVTVVKTEFMLTFDDGPLPDRTTAVLNTLSTTFVNGSTVTAAFFQVGIDGSESIDVEIGTQGSVSNYSGITRDIAQAGHIIANHTAHHYWFERDGTTDETVRTEIQDCQQELIKALSPIGKMPSMLFRPPYLIGTAAVKAGAKAAGMSIVWGVTNGEVARSYLVTEQNALDNLKEWNPVTEHAKA